MVNNKFKLSIVLLVFTFFATISGLVAGSSDWEFGGYAKDLITWSDDDIELLPVRLGQFQNTTQLRLNLFWYPGDNLMASVQTRNLLVYQENIASSRLFLDQLTTSTYYFDLKSDWLEEDNWYGSTEIDRLYLDWTFNDLQVITGRQRIAWGTCLVWNPTDFFNPFDILDFDYEERPGTDAVHVQYYTGPVSQFNMAVTPGRTRYDVIYAGRYVTNYQNYDLALLGGWQKNSLRLAANWAGELFDGGFRGEVLYTRPDIAYQTIVITDRFPGFELVSRDYQDPYWTIALSYDYTFENSFYIHTEGLYNGLGTTEKAGIRRFDVLFTGELSPARYSLFQELAYQVTPLLRADFFIIWNPSDYSWIAAPSVQYSLAANWEAYLLVFPSGGDAGTEYGGYPTQYFARVRFSF